MGLPDILFYVFAALTLVCGVLVVANPFSRNPVTSAMFLVLTIVSMAGLFVLLHAFFLAAVQVLVYAGAVMVLVPALGCCSSSASCGSSVAEDFRSALASLSTPGATSRSLDEISCAKAAS